MNSLRSSRIVDYCYEKNQFHELAQMFTARSTLTGPTDRVCHIGTLMLCIEAAA